MPDECGIIHQKNRDIKGVNRNCPSYRGKPDRGMNAVRSFPTAWRAGSETTFDKALSLPIDCPAFVNSTSTRDPAMRTFSAKPHEVKRDWVLIDATDKVLGRMAAEIARRLRGKHKPTFTPHVDTGDYIVVVNAQKLRVTGNKVEQKIYYRHSTYPGGIYAASFGKLQGKFPGRVLEKAVKGMLPKGALGYAMIKKLKVYAGSEHPHSAQQPQTLNF